MKNKYIIVMIVVAIIIFFIIEIVLNRFVIYNFFKTKEVSTLESYKDEQDVMVVEVKKERIIDPSKPMVALTFDDGPSPYSTNLILDILEKHNVKATFFDLGTCMGENPAISKREESIGCEVETHTYNHSNLNKLSSDNIKNDIEKAVEVYQNTLGHKPKYIRPPYGNANDVVKQTLNYPLINWDIDTLDWKNKDAQSIQDEIFKCSNLDGRIILMHSIYKSTAEAVEQMVPSLLDNGYQLVTIEEMAKYKGINLENGKVYYNFR